MLHRPGLTFTWACERLWCSWFLPKKQKFTNSLITSRDSRKLVTPTCPRREWTGPMMLHGPCKTFTWACKQISCSSFFPTQKVLITSRHSRKLITQTCPRCKWNGSMMLHRPGMTFTWACEKLWCSWFLSKKQKFTNHIKTLTKTRHTDLSSLKMNRADDASWSRYDTHLTRKQIWCSCFFLKIKLHKVR